MESIYWEDLTVGMTFRTRPSEPITEEMIEEYFDLTGDRFNIHRDKSFAQFFGLPDAMVPGNLVVARSTGLVYESGYFADSLVVQAKKSTRFVKPVYIGERIYVTERVLEIEDRATKRYGRVVLERRTLNDRDELVQETIQDYRIVKRAALMQLGVAASA